MNSTAILTSPGPFQLSQNVSADRRSARQATLLLNRKKYQFAKDPGIAAYVDRDRGVEVAADESLKLPPHLAPWAGASRLRRSLAWLVRGLPPKEIFVSELPPEARFRGAKTFRHGAHAGSMKLRLNYVGLTNFDFQATSEAAYSRLLGTIPAPLIRAHWRDDKAFAAQRLRGVNPMAIRRCANNPGDALTKTATMVLEKDYGTTFSAAADAGRVYMTDYPWLWNVSVQGHVRKGAYLAAPTCLFFHESGQKELVPLAIQLKPPGIKSKNPVFSPYDGWDWQMARIHAQAADAHYHEAIYHLLETHLVTEVFTLVTRRQLHEDHPVYQLLSPHFEYNLAINEQARKNLLAPHGEIERCMAAGSEGSMNLARIANAQWSYRDRTLECDLKTRDVQDIPGYFYRDDAQAVWNATNDYVRGICGIWYTDDKAVAEDTELQAWARELSDPANGGIKDFPVNIGKCDELCDIVTNVIFRASAQHAAVNNGQFGTYGWVPNAPVAVYKSLPTRESCAENRLYTEKEFFSALPDRKRTFGQVGMVWLLSEPTERNLLRSGECEAFSPASCHQAYEIVGRYRRALREISDNIDVRNLETGIHYAHLKPQNIDRSIAI